MTPNHQNVDMTVDSEKATLKHPRSVYLLATLVLLMGLRWWASYWRHGFFYVSPHFLHKLEKTPQAGSQAIVLIELTLTFGAILLISAIRSSHRILNDPSKSTRKQPISIYFLSALLIFLGSSWWRDYLRHGFIYSGRRDARTLMTGAEAIVLIAITLSFGTAFLISAIRSSRRILKESRTRV